MSSVSQIFRCFTPILQIETHFQFTMSLSSLDSTRSVLIRYLDVPLIKPYLKEDGLLTDDEYERLQISPQNTSQDAVEKLVRFLKRKGPDHEVRFLSALKRSMNDQEHSGHEYIIQQLTEILTNSESLIVDTSLHGEFILWVNLNVLSLMYQ